MRVDVSKTALITNGTNSLEGVASISNYHIAEDGDSAHIIYRFTAQNSQTYTGIGDFKDGPPSKGGKANMLGDEFDIFFGVLVSNE